MPLVTDYRAVREVYREAIEHKVGLPTLCAEDRETLEAILASAAELGREIGKPDLPVIVSWTSRYPGRGQMKLLPACGDAVLGTRLMLADLKVFTSDDSPYRALRVMPHLDHAFPWLDDDIMSRFADDFASIMCDASEKPFDENIRLTAEFVERVKGRVVVEGAVDEIFESGGQGAKNEPTTVAQAQAFLRRTGVDILVPNVGTEHRATADQIHYRSDRAREISRAVGRILCLHGTSSLKTEDLPSLPGDGFLKINIYTTLAVKGGQALARQVLRSVGNIFDEDEIKDMVGQGVLGQAVLAPTYGETLPPIKPKLNYVANPLRRDAWFAAVKSRCRDFFLGLNYRAFATG